jgi:hypothetical protein
MLFDRKLKAFFALNLKRALVKSLACGGLKSEVQKDFALLHSGENF